MRYSIHPAAKLMPPMTAEEFAALKADIKKHGLREPIVLYKGKVLDGRNRLRACEELGIPLSVTKLDGKIDPEAYVLSRNTQRRLHQKSEGHAGRDEPARVYATGQGASAPTSVLPEEVYIIQPRASQLQ